LILAAVFLAAIWATPARAGQYELVGSTGSGTISVTGDYGNYSLNLTGITCGAGTKRGSISFSATETFTFQWVRDIDPMTGLPDPNDDPVPEAMEAEFGCFMAGFQFSEWAYEDGTGSLSVSGTGNLSFSGTATGTAESGGMMGGGTPWSYSESFTGEPTVLYGFVLTEEEEQITLSVTGSASATGDMEVFVDSVLIGFRRAESITHTLPTPNQTISSPTGSATLTPAGTWKGAKGASYTTKFFFQRSSESDPTWTANGTGGGTGGGSKTSIAWTAGTFILDEGGYGWKHKAQLLLVSGNKTALKAHHTQTFHVVRH
jgi:hypothetical protein